MDSGALVRQSSSAALEEPSTDYTILSAELHARNSKSILQRCFPADIGVLRHQHQLACAISDSCPVVAVARATCTSQTAGRTCASSILQAALAVFPLLVTLARIAVYPEQAAAYALHKEQQLG